LSSNNNRNVNLGTDEKPILIPEILVLDEPDLPKVKEEQVLVCEKCGKELAFALFFVKQEEICPTCHNQTQPNSCWLLCKNCRGQSN